MEPVYVTPEQVMSALDVKPSAYMSRELLRACQAGSRAAEGFLHRIFYPEIMTRTFDYPTTGFGNKTNQLWFDERSLISLTSAASGGINIPTGNVLLRPDTIGPPFDNIELDRNSTSSFSGGPQRAISLTGLWGYRNTEVPNGTLVASPDIAPTVTSIRLSLPVDTGTVIRIESERCIVTGRGWVASGATTSVLSNSKADVAITTTDAANFTPGERIMIDAERMEVQDIAGNVMIVRRAVDGSVLAAHTNGTAMFWQHQLTVERGALGTTAAFHGNGNAIALWVPPTLAAELSQAYAEDFFLQRNAGYARTAGTGDSERQVSGRSIKDMENRASAALRRKVRVRAI